MTKYKELLNLIYKLLCLKGLKADKINANLQYGLLEAEKFNWVPQGWGGFAYVHKHANISKINKGRNVTSTHSYPQQNFLKLLLCSGCYAGASDWTQFPPSGDWKSIQIIHEV